MTAEEGEESEQYELTDCISLLMMPASPLASENSFLVYNPGSEKCGLTLRVAGEANGGKVTFANEATGQKCTLSGFTASVTSDVGKWIEVNGETLQVKLKGAATAEAGYIYHDDGYIFLRPADAEKGIAVEYKKGSGTITSLDGQFREDMLGKYIYLDSGWRKIDYVYSEDKIETVWRAEANGSEDTIVAAMNRITVTKDSGVNLSMLEIDYKPKVR